MGAIRRADSEFIIDLVILADSIRYIIPFQSKNSKRHMVFMPEENRVVIDYDSLILQATQQTGLSDFGDSSFKAPLALLVKAINDEANLTEAGLIGAEQ